MEVVHVWLVRIKQKLLGSDEWRFKFKWKRQLSISIRLVSNRFGRHDMYW
jgi:hypothetical protein